MEIMEKGGVGNTLFERQILFLLTTSQAPLQAIKVPVEIRTSEVHGSFIRNVTDAGLPKSRYTATVMAPQGLKIHVNPSVLSFTSLGQKKTFMLTIDGTIEEPIVSASLVWNDGKFKVRSPIIVFNAS
ncbi:unnamed protein product [Lupinus luteus]|uniref:Subtilisin-like protease fibronectin type-III domain-containing protein n=1 Tax=Lupinus luteus TaxID=3873 RepID=A0AAV1X9M3_LUPLU